MPATPHHCTRATLSQLLDPTWVGGTDGPSAVAATGKPDQDGGRWGGGGEEVREGGTEWGERQSEGAGMVAAFRAKQPDTGLLGSAHAHKPVQSLGDPLPLAVVSPGEGSKLSLPLKRPLAVTQHTARSPFWCPWN